MPTPSTELDRHARRIEDGTDSAEGTRDDVDDDLPQAHVDAGETGGLLVGADRQGVAAQERACS